MRRVADSRSIRSRRRGAHRRCASFRARARRRPSTTTATADPLAVLRSTANDIGMGDPDLPPVGRHIDPATYLALRAQQIAMYRGAPFPTTYNARQVAIEQVPATAGEPDQDRSDVDGHRARANPERPDVAAEHRERPRDGDRGRPDGRERRLRRHRPGRRLPVDERRHRLDPAHGRRGLSRRRLPRDRPDRQHRPVRRAPARGTCPATPTRESVCTASTARTARRRS